MIDVHDRCEIQQLRSRLRIDPHRLKRARVQFYKKQRSAADALAEIPDAMRESFADAVQFHRLELVQAIDSELDGATKLLFATEDRLQIETVILRVKSGRTALCVSSQVGCAAACEFCATGKLGLRRNLTASEILDQVVQANQRLHPEGQRVRNIVFMGMGEPFHNEAALHEALHVLTDSECFHQSPGQISVSTVGIPEAMVRFAQTFPRVRLALSLHSARQEVRESILPLAKRYQLDELHDVIRQVNELQGHPVMLEYLLLRNCNDRAADLEALHEWVEGLDVHINLIPFNPIPDAPGLDATERPQREAFGAELKARGHTVTLRYSLGADIAAACGQLVRESNRR